MRRRDLIAAGTVAAIGMTATAALASESEAPAPAASVNLRGVGLPIITEGRLRNYVFVTVKVTLAAGATPEVVRAKDAYFRDALVRASHRVSFAAQGSLDGLNENAVNAAVMAVANLVCGHGAVVKSEVLTQTPRRRIGAQPA